MGKHDHTVADVQDHSHEVISYFQPLKRQNKLSGFNTVFKSDIALRRHFITCVRCHRPAAFSTTEGAVIHTRAVEELFGFTFSLHAIKWFK